MSNIKDVYADLNKLNSSIKQLLSTTNYEDDWQLSEIELDRKDPNDILLQVELQGIMGTLSELSSTLSYLNSPIKIEGTLHKNENNRYEVDGYEFKSGYSIEYLCPMSDFSEFNEEGKLESLPRWKCGQVEYNGTDYYILKESNLPLEGLKVRIRK